MIPLLLLTVSALADVTDPAPARAAACGEGERRALTTPSTEPHRLACSITLGPDDVVRRPLEIIVGGVRLSCDGGRLIPPGDDPDALLVRTDPAQRLPPPRDVVVEGCSIFGAVRIFGPGRNGEARRVGASSRREGHTERMQGASPSGILFRGVRIVASGTIPFYVGPGGTRVDLVASVFEGESRSTAIYLDAESADNRIVGNTFRLETRREFVAVDGSARNLIADNAFVGSGRGGVFLYRNCGEGGTVRHQAPTGNVIRDNVVAYSRPGSITNVFTRPPPAIWIGSRMGERSYCDADGGYPFGSSIDDTDHARANTVSGNVFAGRGFDEAVRMSDGPNDLSGNVVRED